jgi:carbonic anhydrase
MKPPNSTSAASVPRKELSKRFLLVGSGTLLLLVGIATVSFQGPLHEVIQLSLSKLHWTYEVKISLSFQCRCTKADMFAQVEPSSNGEMVDWSDYLACSQGTQQSPINIDTQTVVPLDESAETEKLEWKSDIHTLDLAHLTEEYNNNVFEIEDRSKPYITVAGTTFRLTEIELHAPSENAIDGEHFDLEIQFRHTAPGPVYMIVSAMFVKGDAEPGVVNQLADIVQRPARTGTQAIEYDAILQSINSTTLNRCHLIPDIQA